MRIEITGANELITTFRTMGDTAADALQSAAKLSLNVYAIRMSEYPPPKQSHGRSSKHGGNRGKGDRLKITATHATVQAHTAIVYNQNGPAYIRTLSLKRGWLNSDPRFELAGAGSLDFTATLHNPTDYASYVQGPQELDSRSGGQAWMHKGNWQTASDIGRELSDFIKTQFEKALSDTFAKLP